jgi:hypothetical protein
LRNKAKREGKPLNQERLKELGANASNVILSSLSRLGTSKFVMYPDQLKGVWEEMAMPSRAFAHTKGVFVVNEEDGYAMIPIKEVKGFSDDSQTG